MIYNTTNQTLTITIRGNTITIKPQSYLKLKKFEEEHLVKKYRGIIYKEKPITTHPTIQNRGVKYDRGVIPLEPNFDEIYDVSVLIPAWKTADYIEECLDSIYKQRPLEILVGVDGCQETLNKLLEIKHKYHNLKVFWSEENVGCYVIRNSLFRKSIGNKIIFFDSDDIMMDELIPTVDFYLNEYDVVRYCFYIFEDDNKNKNKINKTPANGTFAVTKNTFELSGGFLPWVCASDYEFKCRTKNFVKEYLVDTALFHYRKHSSALTRKEDTKMNSKIRNELHANIPEKYNDMRIDGKYIKLTECFCNINTNWKKQLSEYYKFDILTKKSKANKLFTVWVGSPTLPKLQEMCLRSMILSGNEVKLYSYIKYKNIPKGVEWINLEPILPQEKCLSNFKLTGNNQVGDSFSTIGDIIRILILSQTDDIWIDSDVFVLKNITEFKKSDIISGIISRWYKQQKPCFGIMGISNQKEIKKELSSLVNEYVIKNTPPKRYCKYIKYIQNELLQKHYSKINSIFLPHLFCCPISVKHKNDLISNFKIPKILEQYIFGIHLWNTAFGAKEFEKYYLNKNTLFGIMFFASQSKDYKTFLKRTSSLWSKDITNIDKFYLNNLELNSKIETWANEPHKTHNKWLNTPKSVIINLDEATDRWEHIKKYNILNAKRVTPIPLYDSELLEKFEKTKNRHRDAKKRKQEISNILTFRNIIQEAKKNNTPRILRIEDDLELIGDLDQTLKHIDQLPSDFGICHLGLYFRKTSLNKGVLKKFNNNFLELGSGLKTWGLQAMIINHTIYDKILEDLATMEPYYKSLDYYIQTSIVGNYRCFLADPMIALQKEEFNKDSIHGLKFNKKMYEKTLQIMKTLLHSKR